MPTTLESLGRQMGSLQSIHGIVHTMKTISVINSAPYEQAACAIEEYHKTVIDGLQAFFFAARPRGHDPQNFNRRVLVVFGSDHGLCGSYNETTAGYVAEHLSQEGGAKSIVLCIGAQMADALADQAIAVSSVFLPAASSDGLGRMANLLLRHLDKLRQDAEPGDIAVDLAFMGREKSGHAPCIVPLLPLGPAFVEELRAKPWLSRSLPTFSMPPTDLFRALLRNHVFAGLVRAAAEAKVTENAARLALMQQAEKSIEDRLDVLKSDANALRQSAITSELLDVIIGFEALRGKRRRDARATEGNPTPGTTPTEERRTL